MDVHHVTALTLSGTWQTLESSVFICGLVRWLVQCSERQSLSSCLNWQLLTISLTECVRLRPQATVTLRQTICDPATKPRLGPLARPTSRSVYATRLASAAPLSAAFL